MAYQTNLLVMNAGGYKFSDFVKSRCSIGNHQLVNVVRFADVGI